MEMAKGLLVSLFISLLLTACSHQVDIPSSQNTSTPVISMMTKEVAWDKRNKVLAYKRSWNLKSKIALSYDEESWTFGLKWVQRAANKFAMQINNPVTGAVVAKLTRDSSGVSLLSDDGSVYRDNDEERLLKQQTGVLLPLKGMQYWVRGLSSSQYKVDKLVLDDAGRPLTIHQAGWKITYLNYVNGTYLSMPRKIVITRKKNNVRLKMIAKQWQGL